MKSPGGHSVADSVRSQTEPIGPVRMLKLVFVLLAISAAGCPPAPEPDDDDDTAPVECPPGSELGNNACNAWDQASWDQNTWGA